MDYNGIKVKWVICLSLNFIYFLVEYNNYYINNETFNFHFFFNIFISLALIYILLFIPILPPNENNIAFIHPYCDSGGGGERVLWCIIRELLAKLSNSDNTATKNIVIYFWSHNKAIKCAEPSKTKISLDPEKSSAAINSNTRANKSAKNFKTEFEQETTNSNAQFGNRTSRDHMSSNEFNRETQKPINKYNSFQHDPNFIPLTKESPLVLDIKKRFEIDLTEHLPRSPNSVEPVNLYLVPLRTAFLLNPNLYPVFTLFAQGLASIFVSIEALIRFYPLKWIDTTGFSFSCILPHLMGRCVTSAYVHYPMIYNQIVEDVSKRKSFIYNKNWITSSLVLTTLKLIYYKLFIFFYKFCGLSIQNKVVNSTWTKTRIDEIWKCNSKILFPPCDFDRFIKHTKSSRRNVIVSLSQFRPEKRHELQLKIFEKLLEDYSEKLPQDIKLYMCGSTRGQLDENIVTSLQSTINQSKILKKHVYIYKNLPMEIIIDILCSSKVALHTMTEEHFGICLLEFLASGLIVVADNTGGPALDILKPLKFDNCKEPINHASTKIKSRMKQSNSVTQIGFLASSFDDYIDMLLRCFTKYDDPYIYNMLEGAKKSLTRFKNNKQFGEAACYDLGIFINA